VGEGFATYPGKYNLNVTCPDGECSKNVVSSPSYASSNDYLPQGLQMQQSTSLFSVDIF